MDEFWRLLADPAFETFANDGTQDWRKLMSVMAPRDPEREPGARQLDQPNDHRADPEQILSRTVMHRPPHTMTARALVGARVNVIKEQLGRFVWMVSPQQGRVHYFECLVEASPQRVRRVISSQSRCARAPSKSYTESLKKWIPGAG